FVGTAVNPARAQTGGGGLGNAQATVETKAAQPQVISHYLNEGHTLRSWLLTTDHKRIAILFLISITFFFFIAGVAALLMRLELLTPKGDLLKAETYNRLF